MMMNTTKIASRLFRFGSNGSLMRFFASNAAVEAQKYVKVNDESNYRRIIMCNDRERNALGLDMIRSLQQAVDSTDLNKCRALVISSAQLNVFSAGYYF